MNVARQQAVYDAIAQYYRAYGVPPTRRRLAEMVGLSVSNVHYYIRKLAQKQLLVIVDRHPVPVEIKAFLENYTPTEPDWS